MDARSKIDMQKTGTLTVERHTMHLKLFGDDEQQFLNNPSKFLEEYFNKIGEPPRKLMVFQRPSSAKPSGDLRIERLHVIFPPDEKSYTWVEIYWD
jgi:hypothetical protein